MSNYNLPEDIYSHGNLTSPMSPLYREVETECYSCGSPMISSSIDKDKLVCENSDSCDVIIDLSDSGMNDW